MAKRITDVLMILCSLPILIPLLLVVVCAIRLTLGKPIFFVQPRAGLKGRTFQLWKFRSMKELRDANGKLLPDNQRITAVGAFLRRTSIDELPSLWNVFVGDMSLVGPRPLLVDYLPRYTAEQMRRHDVLPGITGLAQISGRRSLRFSERIAHDLWYVRHRTMMLDIKILILTALRPLDRLHAHQVIEEVDDLGLPQSELPSTGIPNCRDNRAA